MTNIGTHTYASHETKTDLYGFQLLSKI